MRSIEQAFEVRRVSDMSTAYDMSPVCDMSRGSDLRTMAARRRPMGASGSMGAARSARLTRRGRLVVVGTVLLLLVLAGFTVGRVSSQAAGPARPLPTVTVEPGESLWQIAARVAPTADRRLVVRQIEQLNDLSDGRVLVGQQLRLPR